MVCLVLKESNSDGDEAREPGERGFVHRLGTFSGGGVGEMQDSLRTEGTLGQISSSYKL